MYCQKCFSTACLCLRKTADPFYFIPPPPPPPIYTPPKKTADPFYLIPPPPPPPIYTPPRDTTRDWHKERWDYPYRYPHLPYALEPLNPLGY